MATTANSELSDFIKEQRDVNKQMLNAINGIKTIQSSMPTNTSPAAGKNIDKAVKIASNERVASAAAMAAKKAVEGYINKNSLRVNAKNNTTKNNTTKNNTTKNNTTKNNTTKNNTTKNNTTKNNTTKNNTTKKRNSSKVNTMNTNPSHVNYNNSSNSNPTAGGRRKTAKTRSRSSKR
jgi:hypothetical protein